MSKASVILCVDDEPIGLAARHVLLSVAGYTVLTAPSLGDALSLFRFDQVDLVIIAGPVPDPSRPGLVSEMKQFKPNVPIALLTDLVAPSSALQEADLLLTKGITPTEFLAEIAALLTTPRSLEAGSDSQK